MNAPDLTPRVDTAAIRALADAASSEGDWAFATAPAEGSAETPSEWMAGALTGHGPLYAVYIPATVGDPDGFLVTAVTGDGPNAGANAAFIAAARTAVPALCDEVDRLRAVVEAVEAFSEHVERAGRVYGYAVAHDLRAAIASVTGGAR